MNCERLVCVVTYNRKSVVDLWLRAWANAEKYGCKIAVMHSHDGEEPDESEKENILKHNPDFYVPFKNTKLRDMEALLMVLGGRAGLPEWDQLFWFTDDMLPMRRTFLRPFVEKISDPKVGLVAQCYEPRTVDGRGDHIRTVAYAINKDVGNRLMFPTVGNVEERPYMFEHGRPGVYENHILSQVRAMGYEFRLCHSDPKSKNYQHWTSFLDWMWDCHLLASWEHMWPVYHAQFDPVQPWEGVDSRSDCLLTRREFEQRTLIKGKVCAIIPTSTAPLEYLMWAVLSLIIRSDRDRLEHIIVGINGPDERSGDPGLQDKKQKFLEDLRAISPVGITITRTWSRIGHAQTMDQCVPWVHTEFYLSMHDDIMVTDKDWCSELEDFESDGRMAVKLPLFFDHFHWQREAGETSVLRPLGAWRGHPMWAPEDRVELSHPDTSFMLCNKSIMQDVASPWVGYYVPMKFNIGNLSNYEQFMGFHEERDISSDETVWPKPSKDKTYSLLSVDVGGVMMYDLIKRGYVVSTMKKERFFHFRGKSWRGTPLQESHRPFINKLEEELLSHTDFLDIYKRHKP